MKNEGVFTRNAFQMATGHLHLWLLVFLCWFVLRGDPVTQEEISQTTSEDLPDVGTGKVYLTGTQQEATPNLVSLSYTESIITDNIEASSLVVRPPIAPATPYEDIKISSSISNDIPVNDKLLEHENNKDQSSELEEIQSQNLNEGIKPESKDDEISKEIQDITKKITKDVNENDIDDFDLREPKYESSSSEMAAVEGIDINVNEEKIDSKQGVTGENMDSWENKIDQTKEWESSEGSIVPEDTLVRDPVSADNEMSDTSTEDSQSDVDEDIVGTRDDLEGTRDDLEGSQEDMPSFKEWSQKFLAQEEKKNKEQQNNEKGNSESSTQIKKKKPGRKQNNYASVDCGAKILEKNNEAQNAESILLENKDFYMLNPCSANIWFIVELCDHVQVTSLQLANFELFSSTIKHLEVSFSTRYPTREWTQLQTLTAISDKSIQTFTLEPIFAKYMKVEQLSYHGSEHYCPWSLLRVYGNSMVEEYEEHESSHNIDSTVDDDESTSSNVKEDKHVTKGILKSATDAVLNFVKETAKKLVHSETAVNSSSADANQTNSTKYPEESPTHEPLTSDSPKTIVQLMDPEDFKASCHEVADEVYDGENKKCLPRNVCDSTKYAGHSYQMFLEIIHNICSRDSRNAKACFSNLTKIFAVNKSIETPSLKSKPKENEVTSEKTDALGKLDESAKKATQVEASNTKEPEDSEEREKFSSSAVLNSVTIANEEETKENLLPVISHTQSSLTLDSVEVHIDSSEILPLVLPSSSHTADSSSSSTSTPSMVKVERPSSPTPLAQPPLAVKLKDIPTEHTITIVNENGGHKGNSAFSSTEPNQGSISTVVVPQVSASQSYVSEHVTPHASSETTASVSHERLVPSLAVNAVEDDRGSLDQASPGNEGDVMLMKGLNEDKPDPNVDVLKITLTDEETKEGTAELDQTNQDEPGVSDSSENKENSVEENIKSEAVAPYEPQGLEPQRLDPQRLDPQGLETNGEVDGVKKEEFDVTNGSEAKENEILRSETVKGDAFVKIGRTDDLKKEHEENMIGKEEDLPSIQDVPGMGEHEHLDQNDALAVTEATCEKQENEAYEESRKAATMKLQMEETSREGATDADPGPTLPAGNVQHNGKKESIFVAMSRKIKALEQNVTMTNLFLEELSQRYRKSLEEMQKKLEKNLSKMSKNSKQLSEVNLSQNSTIIALASRIEKLEEKLNEATSHLKVVNQEVVERHVLGMCIQFVIVFVLWYVFARNRTPHSIPDTHRTQDTGPKHPPDESVSCNGKDRVEENGKNKISNGRTRNTNGNVVDDTAHDRSSLDEFALPKNLDTMPEAKRRRRRRNRSAYGGSCCDQFLGNRPANHGQNIVTRTAGLLFHTPESHGGSEATIDITTNTAQRSCSADGLDDIARNHDERRINTKRSALSPKARKVGFSTGRNGGAKAHSAPHLGDSMFTGGKQLNDNTRKGLVRSKSSGDCYEHELSLYNNDLASRNIAPSSSRCLVQPDNDYDQLNKQKARWICGLG